MASSSRNTVAPPRRRTSCAATIIGGTFAALLAWGIAVSQQTPAPGPVEAQECKREVKVGEAPTAGVKTAEGSTSLPADPLQRCARKALRGDFGKLTSWQANGYQAAVQQGATIQGRAWVTSYYPSEGFPRGQHCRSGIGVSERSAAVRSCDWKRYRGCWVWTAAYGLRVVEDTGANSNHGVARRKGADLWLDYWFPRARNRNPITPYAFVRRSP